MPVPPACWISVTHDHQTRRFEAPEDVPGLLLWIRLTYDRHYDAHTPLFAYDLFSPELIPLQMKTGNFTCLRICDHCRKAGCGTHLSVMIEIADKNNVVRKFRGFDQQEAGVIGAFEFMRNLHGHEDWADYDAMIELSGALGVPSQELQKMLAKELAGTGIRLDNDPG